MAHLLGEISHSKPIADKKKYICASQGIDILPSNLLLADMEVELIHAMCRETTLKRALEYYKQDYDVAIIDTLPSLGVLAINAFATSDYVIVPIQADDYFSVTGVMALINSVENVKYQINPNLEIAGAVITKLDKRTVLSKQLCDGIQQGELIKIFENKIPTSTKAAQTAGQGKTILEYDPNGKVAQAYKQLSRELLQII